MQTNNIDVCAITESWLTPDVPSEIIDIAGYTCYRRDRMDGRQGGGVVCYVRQDQPFTLIKPVEDDSVESLWLLYRKPRMPRSISHLLVGVVYHPPDVISHVTSTHIVDNVDAVVQQHPNTSVLIVGDFNHMIDRPLTDMSLKQIVKSATRKTAILDKIYTNIDAWYQQPQILPSIARSDHESVMLTPVNGGVRTTGQRITSTIRSSDRNNKSQLARDLMAFDWSAIEDMQSVDSMTSYFYDVTTTMLNHYLPLREITRYSTDKPWVTEEFRRLVRKRQYAWTHNNRTEYNRLRNAVNRLSSKLRRRFYQRQIENLRACDSSNWWRQTKKLTGQISKPELTGLANEVTNGDMQGLASCINNALLSVSADLNRLDPEGKEDTRQEAPPSEFEYIISPEEVFHRMEHIKTRKSPGPDNLPNWFLRDFAFALCEPLRYIFNSSIHEGVVPSIWKQANIIVIPKTKPPKSVEQDLRPISLTPTVSKVFESLVGRRLLLTVADKFDKRQFGGIKGRSTSHALVDILHTWNKALDEEQSVRVLFIDYAKAFDHVDHKTVITKLAALGISPNLLRWIRSFLTNRQQRVKIGDLFSDWSSPNGGMPQGTWLGPFVFLSLINDLQSALQLHKYVDDCTLTEVMSKLSTSSMQQELDAVNNWSQANYMNINTKKTKEMLLRPNGRNPQTALQLNCHVIEQVKSYKLLGLHVTDDLRWGEHVSTICSKAAQRLHFLKQLKRAAMSTSDLVYYYQSVIRPVVEYACVVWATSITKNQSDLIERIQRRAAKIIFGHEVDALKSLALPSLHDRREQLTKQFFTSLLSPNSCLHHLIPAEFNNEQTDKLRHVKQFPPPLTRTERFKKSTIVYCLNNYQ